MPPLLRGHVLKQFRKDPSQGSMLFADEGALNELGNGLCIGGRGSPMEMHDAQTRIDDGSRRIHTALLVFAERVLGDAQDRGEHFLRLRASRLAYQALDRGHSLGGTVGSRNSFGLHLIRICLTGIAYALQSYYCLSAVC